MKKQIILWVVAACTLVGCMKNKKGNFTQAFTAASLMEGADSASFTVDKKELTLHLEKGEVKSDYLLTYDSRTGTFNAKQKN